MPPEAFDDPVLKYLWNALHASWNALFDQFRGGRKTMEAGDMQKLREYIDQLVFKYGKMKCKEAAAVESDSASSAASTVSDVAKTIKTAKSRHTMAYCSSEDERIRDAFEHGEAAGKARKEVAAQVAGQLNRSPAAILTRRYRLEHRNAILPHKTSAGRKSEPVKSSRSATVAKHTTAKPSAARIATTSRSSQQRLPAAPSTARNARKQQSVREVGHKIAREMSLSPARRQINHSLSSDFEDAGN